MLRSQINWAERPGSFDVLHTNLIFESHNEYGYPEIGVPTLEFPDLVLPFNYVTKKHEPSIVHTFIEDYQLERVWKNPERYLDKLEHDLFISPDFSLYTDTPRALQIFNTYKNRYVGRFMSEYGISVIPSVSWSDSGSFDFCFEGINRGSIVAISSSGTKRKDLSPFMNGVEVLLRRINPPQLICYGATRKTELDSLHSDVKYLPTFTEAIRARYQMKHNQK